MQGASELTGVPVEALTGAGKKREAVGARSLLCFWAVKELGISLTELAGRLGIAVLSAVRPKEVRIWRSVNSSNSQIF